MKNAAKIFYDSLDKFEDLERLINEGESENLFLECKSPTTPTLSSDLRKTLSKAVSGFSNTNGGVIIWGMSTTNKSHSGLDIITQIEPIGNCRKFLREIENRIPTLSVPSILNFECKIILEKESSSRGVVLTYIPKHIGDPIQSAEDEYFYFRSGDDFVKTPHEMLKRLFAATASPDLKINFDNRFVKINHDGFWEFPIVITNQSSAIGEKIKIFIVTENWKQCESIAIPSFVDVSHANPQFPKSLILNTTEIVYKGLDLNLGNVKVKLKGKKKILIFKITIYADKMSAKEVRYKLKLLKEKFTTIILESKDI